MPNLETLIQENLNELHDEGRLGLYEIAWALHSSHPALTDNERIAYAKDVAAAIIGRGGFELYWYKWPNTRISDQRLTLREVPEDEWLHASSDRNFVAIVAIEDGP